MNTTTRSRLLTTLAVTASALALGVTLAGCSTGAGAHTSTGTAPAASSTSAPAASAPASTPSAPTPTASTPSATTRSAPTVTPPAPGAPAAGTANATTTGAGSTHCPGTALTGAVTVGSGGAAGSTLPDLVLTNHSSSTCTLQGWPGVSFVGHGNGTQIGAAAVENRTTSHPTVAIRPGGTAVVPMRVAQAENFPTASCQPVSADGFRVYPPGSTAALFVKATGFTACAKPSASLLTVSAVVPGS